MLGSKNVKCARWAARVLKLRNPSIASSSSSVCSLRLHLGELYTLHPALHFLSTIHWDSIPVNSSALPRPSSIRGDFRLYFIRVKFASPVELSISLRLLFCAPHCYLPSHLIVIHWGSTSVNFTPSILRCTFCQLFTKIIS